MLRSQDDKSVPETCQINNEAEAEYLIVQPRIISSIPYTDSVVPRLRDTDTGSHQVALIGKLGFYFRIGGLNVIKTRRAARDAGQFGAVAGTREPTRRLNKLYLDSSLFLLNSDPITRKNVCRNHRYHRVLRGQALEACSQGFFDQLRDEVQPVSPASSTPELRFQDSRAHLSLWTHLYRR